MAGAHPMREDDTWQLVYVTSTLVVWVGGTWTLGSTGGGSERAGGPHGGGALNFAYASPWTPLAFPLLVTRQEDLSRVGVVTILTLSVLQALGRGACGVGVQQYPPERPGEDGQEALVWLSPVWKLRSQCPAGALALHVGFMSTAQISFQWLCLFARHKAKS